MQGLLDNQAARRIGQCQKDGLHVFASINWIFLVSCDMLVREHSSIYIVAGDEAHRETAVRADSFYNAHRSVVGAFLFGMERQETHLDD